MSRKIPAILAGIYGALVALSIVPIFTGDDAMNGVFAVVLGLPWTVLISNIADAIDPSLTDSVSAGMLMVVAGGAINAAIIYLVSRWIVRRRPTKATV